MMRYQILWTLAVVGGMLGNARGEQVRAEEASADTLREIVIPTTIDGAEQPGLLYLPRAGNPDGAGAAVPLVVSLHSWSTGYRSYDAYKLTLAGCQKRGWAFLSPQFRGPNVRPEACASDLAVQDVLDAVAYVRQHARIDSRRIYLLGGSGGGHMALAMAHRAPQLWAGVSSWVPITDLVSWHQFCQEHGFVYSERIEKCLNGPPGTPDRDQEYRKRSPIHWLARAKGLPIDIQTGIHDGHGGRSVPIDHSLRAFNVLADANGQRQAMLSDEEIDIFTRTAQVPERLAAQRENEPGRKHSILFRRSAGPVRLTVFDGAHEIDPNPALTWLEEQSKSEQ